MQSVIIFFPNRRSLDGFEHPQRAACPTRHNQAPSHYLAQHSFEQERKLCAKDESECDHGRSVYVTAKQVFVHPSAYKAANNKI